MTSGKIQGSLLFIGIAVSILSGVIAYGKYVKKDIIAMVDIISALKKIN